MRRVLAIVIATLAVLGTPAAASAKPDPSAGRATSWYLALGDSLAAGYQPGVGDDRDGGYVGGVLDALQESAPKAKLTNLSCSGATTASMLGTDRCTYEQGSQVDAAVQFLRAHKSKVDLVTIDIGANDVTPCARGTVDVACAIGAVGTVERNLTTILGRLRAATGPQTQIIVLNYYNPFLAAWLTGAAGQQVAALTTQLQSLLNGAVSRSAATADADVADVATAFRSTNTTPVTTAYGTIPTNVATICAWTWMCSRNDIHANDTGYAVLAGVVAGRLD
ncbi:SGNH/GDSL hydrolase family protein [Knoellia sp. LjRoot47]|uniref:SGNH/GDSL hydrolase family protein n=1 Tax=Knoellia sp. LjRoot47 TaxID=3342330 RepID=UPI003ECDF314